MAGRERLFSLLDEIETTWVGPPTTIHRRIRAVFSRIAWEVISEPRILRTVDLSVFRILGPRRELARRLFTSSKHNPATSSDAGSRSSNGLSMRGCSRASERNAPSGRSPRNCASPDRRSRRPHRATAASSSSSANGGRPARGRDFVAAVRTLAERAALDPSQLDRPPTSVERRRTCSTTPSSSAAANSHQTAPPTLAHISKHAVSPPTESPSLASGSCPTPLACASHSQATGTAIPRSPPRTSPVTPAGPAASSARGATRIAA